MRVKVVLRNVASVADGGPNTRSVSSNGHTYQIICTSQQGSGKASCNCVDDAKPRADGPIEVSDECPLKQEIALGACGW